jgi:hypothetical protein
MAIGIGGGTAKGVMCWATTICTRGASPVALSVRPLVHDVTWIVSYSRVPAGGTTGARYIRPNTAHVACAWIFIVCELPSPATPKRLPLAAVVIVEPPSVAFKLPSLPDGAG